MNFNARCPLLPSKYDYAQSMESFRKGVSHPRYIEKLTSETKVSGSCKRYSSSQRFFYLHAGPSGEVECKRACARSLHYSTTLVNLFLIGNFLALSIYESLFELACRCRQNKRSSTCVGWPYMTHYP